MEAADLIDGLEPEPSETDGVTIWPIKLGVIKTTDLGRHVTVKNPASFSLVRDSDKFTFIDTGEDGLSNTLFTGEDAEPQLGGWDNDKPNVVPGDIERQMAIGYIDQYQRSVTSWEGQLYSNQLAFYNMITLAHKADKIFMQLNDSYNNRTCEHNIQLAEAFEEYTTPNFSQQNDYYEYDIEEEQEND
jgi:hypothetical protein